MAYKKSLRPKRTNRKKYKNTRKRRNRGGGKHEGQSRGEYSGQSRGKYRGPYTSRSILDTAENSRGSNLRDALVGFCRKDEIPEYDALTNQIISEIRDDGKKDFLIHLDNQMVKQQTFSFRTLVCLERALMRLQEEAIHNSMPLLEYVIKNVLVEVFVDGEWKNGRAIRLNKNGTYYIILEGNVHKLSVHRSIIKWRGEILKK